MRKTSQLCKAGIFAAAICWCAPLAVQAQALNVGVPTGSSCPTGYHWEMALGFAQCIADPPPTPKDPETPSCLFQKGFYEITIGPAGNCTADGGCEGSGFSVFDGSATPVQTEVWYGVYYYDETKAEIDARADAAMAKRGYSRGAVRVYYSGTGNQHPYQGYEVCK